MWNQPFKCRVTVSQLAEFGNKRMQYFEATYAPFSYTFN